jgi:beta-phosphoglucomutase-like phosphatase (HAD superfamily)
LLVIFDCDGVLVDSEPLANASFSRALKAQGLDWSVEETMRRLMGLSLKSCFEIVEAELGRKAAGRLPREDAGGHLPELPRRTLAAGRRREGGGAGAAGGRPRDLRRELGSPEKMRFTLGLTGLWDLFDGRIFSSSQVPRGKPFPDLFLHAAISMNEQPFDCVVVEDSVPGVQAARLAGMRALAYAGAPYANRDALGAAGGFLFSDMKQLPELVRE